MKKSVYRRFILVLLWVSFLPVVSAADTEPNSTFETASSLAIGASTAGSVNGSSDPADWYRVEVPEDGELTITVTHDPSDFQFILYGRDDAFEITGTETNAPSGRRLVRSVQEGTYHIQVNSRGNFSPVGYTILVTLDAVPSVTSDTASNDTPDLAGPVSLNFEETGHISHTRDDRTIDNADYYLIDLPADADVSFTFTHEPQGMSFQFRVFRSDGVTDIFGTETNFPSGDTRTRSLAAGRYYLLVDGRGETHGRSYRFTVNTDTRPAVTADSEPNDTVENASLLSLDTDHIGHISHTRDSGDVDNLDYYRLELPVDAEVSFTFAHEPQEHSFQFRLLRSDGITDIFGTETNFPSGDTRTRSLAGGTYFLEVNGRGETQGRTYRFKVEIDTRPAVTADNELNDTVENASLLSLDTDHIGHISHTRDTGVVDNLDYYRFDLSEEVEVSFTFSHDPAGHSFQFRILESDGRTSVFGTETNFPSGDTRTRTLAGGTYFLEVNGRGSTQGRTYSFSVDTPQGENRAPTAVIAHQTVAATPPFAVRFDGTGSSDTDGRIVSYLWEISDGRTSTESIFTLVFEDAGQYRVKLTVADDAGLTHTAEETFRLTESAAGNEATLTSDLVLFIPRLRYDSGFGAIVASVTMKYESISPSVIFFEVTEVVILGDTGVEENEATLSFDLNLHIPFIRYSSLLGEILVSADLKGALVADKLLFEVVEANVISQE